MSEKGLPIRLQSADVYRGFVMLLMMAEILNFHHVSRELPDSNFWNYLAFNQDHVSWVGCSLHDLIQPSFTFLVGLVLPYSILNRKAKGENFQSLLSHTLRRSIILITLGIFLRSIGSKMTNYTFEDTLTQIGLGYTFLYILGLKSFRFQILFLVLILVGYWLAFVLYPLPPSSFNYESVFVAKNTEHLRGGFLAHWNKNSNIAWAFDQWFLNLFPRESPFIANEGGYATLSFIPTLGTMIMGLQAGNLLINEGPQTAKIKTLILYGLGCIILGTLLNFLGICPIVKRIWTPAWVLFSGGICFLFTALFYYVVDIKKKQKWFFGLWVIGVNSITAYVIAHTIIQFLSQSLYTHLGENYDIILGTSYRTLIHGGLIFFFEWLILYWMYRKKIFIKI